MKLLLIAALGLIVYTYVGFPLLLMLRGWLASRPVRRGAITPPVSMVIVAHNEAATIESKLENVYALDYPRSQLEVIVASDGSDDGTNELVASFGRPGLRLLEFPRSGKIPALNAAVSHASGEILVFSDANSMYTPDALRELVSPFADPRVGAVGGNQRYVPEGREHMASVGERAYWNYDRMLKSSQSRAGSMTSATGAIHAIRRDLFRPVPLGVSDDFMTSTRAIRSGYRLAFAENAVAYESVAATERAEFSRKMRITTRGLRAIWLSKELLNPFRYGFYSLQLLTHKLLRWSVCWLMLLVFVSSIALYGDGTTYRLLVKVQLILYACALSGWVLRHTSSSRRKVFRVFGIPFYFCLANYAALRAWLQVLSGARVDRWDSQRAQVVGV